METLRRTVNGLLRSVEGGGTLVGSVAAELRRVEDAIVSICVVGNQSSGKSSLINRLLPPSLREAGFRIPTGKGMCTRVPIWVTMYHAPELETFYSLEDKDGKIEDLSRFAAKFDKWQEALDGVQNTPLVVRIGAPDVDVSYTLIDVPGLREALDAGAEVRDLVRAELAKADVALVVHEMGDPDNITALRLLKDMDGEDAPRRRDILVFTHGDQPGNMEKVPVSHPWLTDKEWYVTCTAKSPKEEVRAILAACGKRELASRGCGVGSEALRKQIASLYRELCADRGPGLAEQVTAVASRAEETLARIGVEKPSAEAVRARVLDRVDAIRNPLKGADSRVDRALGAAVGVVTDLLPETWLTDLLAGGTFAEEVVRSCAQSAGVRIAGTESAFDFIACGFARISRALEGDMLDALRTACDTVSSALIDTVSEDFPEAHYATIRTMATKTIDAARLAGTSEVLARFRDALHEPPTSVVPYPGDLPELLAIAAEHAGDAGALAAALEEAARPARRAERAVVWYWSHVFRAQLLHLSKVALVRFSRALTDALWKTTVEITDADLPVEPESVTQARTWLLRVREECSLSAATILREGGAPPPYPR